MEKANKNPALLELVLVVVAKQGRRLVKLKLKHLGKGVKLCGGLFLDRVTKRLNKDVSIC